MNRLGKRHCRARTHPKPEPDVNFLEFFKVFIPEHASHQLLIPPAFQMHLKKNLAQKSIIIGPDNRTWIVNLKREGKDYFFKEGWQDFVKDHAIELGDFLVFRFDGKSSFSVKLYGQNGCSKKINTSVETASEINGKTVRVKEEPIDFEFVEKHKSGINRKEDRQSSEALEHRRVAAQVQQTIYKRKMGTPPRIYRQRFQRSQNGEEAEPMQRTTWRREVGRPLEEDSPSFGGGEAAQAQQTLNTNNEIDADLDVDSRNISKPPSFRTFLTASQIRRCFLNVPIDFVRTCIPGGSRDIYLQVSDQLWLVRLLIYPNWFGRLSKGWSAFVRDNYLEHGDVCVFELLKLNPYLTLKVSISKCS